MVISPFVPKENMHGAGNLCLTSKSAFSEERHNTDDDLKCTLWCFFITHSAMEQRFY